MTITDWSANVNSKFFGFNDKPKENTKKTEYVSGRVTAYNVNTRSVMTFTCSLQLNKTELEAFWNWFNDDLGGQAGVFRCEGLGNRLYRFSDIPTPQDTNQLFRVLSMNIEEVY